MLAKLILFPSCRKHNPNFFYLKKEIRLLVCKKEGHQSVKALKDPNGLT